MRNVFEYYDEGTYLEHHGIRGQKWGVRRFQNPDGSLTAEGQKRYAKELIDADKGFTDKMDVYNKKSVIKKKDRDNIYKETVKGQNARKKFYESSKECNKILNEVRSKRAKFLEDQTDESFNEMDRLLKDFKKASRNVFSDALKTYGDESIKNAKGNYALLDVLTDKSGDDFWYYAYGDWK